MGTFMRRKVVVFLQNAWSPFWAGKQWPREYWLLALRRSRSGQRLNVFEEALKNKYIIWYDNTTPQVGTHPNSVLPPDLEHMQAVLTEQKPLYVVACGVQAERALIRMGVTKHMLAMPHPAHRLLTNTLYYQAGTYLRYGFKGCVKFVQGKGEITVRGVL